MALKQYFTTGEAAELLHISRSTISRKFDRNVFFGKKNPITGERMISRDSIAAFMKQYNLPTDVFAVEKKRVLVGTPDGRLFSILQKVFSEDERVQLERYEFGGDVLVRCSRERPDLLILDEELSDIPCAEVIRSLRRREEQRGLGIFCLARAAKGTKRCIEWGADEALAREGLEQQELRQKLYTFLGLSEEPSEGVQSFEHLRRWPRVSVNLPAKIGVYRMRSPHKRDRGEATVDNISCGGGFLSGIQLESGVIPCEPFRIFLEIDQDPLKNLKTHCKVVRLQSNGSLGAGVQFTRLSRSNLHMIEAISQ